MLSRSDVYHKALAFVDEVLSREGVVEMLTPIRREILVEEVTAAFIRSYENLSGNQIKIV